MGTVPEVCSSFRAGPTGCFSVYPQELAIAYSRTTGSSWVWFGAASVALVTFGLGMAILARASATLLRRTHAAVRQRQWAAAFLLALSLAALAALGGTYRPPTKPDSYTTYPVPSDATALGSCRRRSGEDTVWTSSWLWNLRPPTTLVTEGRDALLLAGRDEGSRDLTLLALDAEDLFPIWSVGPCTGRLTHIPDGAALAVLSHILVINADGYTTHAWWLRKWDNHLEYDAYARTLKASVPWDFEERRQVRIEIDPERGAVTEQLVDASAVPDAAPPAEMPFWTRGGARFLIRGQLYELDYVPFAIRRRGSDDLDTVVASFPAMDIKEAQ